MQMSGVKFLKHTSQHATTPGQQSDASKSSGCAYSIRLLQIEVLKRETIFLFVSEVDFDLYTQKNHSNC